ncbi:MAG: hypothetical protein V4558_08740 [Gemmatimonadota bacterium]
MEVYRHDLDTLRYAKVVIDSASLRRVAGMEDADLIAIGTALAGRGALGVAGSGCTESGPCTGMKVATWEGKEEWTTVRLFWTNMTPKCTPSTETTSILRRHLGVTRARSRVVLTYECEQ